MSDIFFLLLLLAFGAATAGILHLCQQLMPFNPSKKELP